MRSPSFLARSLPVIAVLAALGASASLGACYPDFSFGGDGTGGAGAASSTETVASRASVGPGGGDDATTTNTVSQSATVTSTTTGVTASSSSGAALPQVGCLDDTTDIVTCVDGESCCFHNSDGSLDECRFTSDCGNGYSSLLCDGDEDCPGAQVCCVRMYELVVEVQFDDFIGCADSCAYPSQRACHTQEDCPSGTCVGLFDGYYAVSAPDYLDAYRFCAP